MLESWNEVSASTLKRCVTAGKGGSVVTCCAHFEAKSISFKAVRLEAVLTGISQYMPRIEKQAGRGSLAFADDCHGESISGWIPMPSLRIRTYIQRFLLAIIFPTWHGHSHMADQAIDREAAKASTPLMCCMAL